MDGNGRWAKARGLPRIKGHQAGVDAIRDTAEACSEWGIKYLTLYSFSTENWSRPKAEIDFLMKLLKRYLENELETLQKNNIRLCSIGFSSDLPQAVQRDLNRVVRLTEKNTGLVLTLALSYGSRAEIVEAARTVARDVLSGKFIPEEIDESIISARLQTVGLPDPDLLIRTSGEMRLSNFLLWQLAYTELWITPVLWPDFRRHDLFEALQDYAKRERRFGAVGSK
jgi:undecaprenyl diphosphate synthase